MEKEHHHRRFYIEFDLKLGNIIQLPENLTHQISNIFRLKRNDFIYLFNNDGNDYKALIKKISTKNIDVEIVDCFQNNTKPVIDLTIVIGRPKLQKIELIIQKCIELGVSNIIIAECERSIGNPLDQDRISRLNRIAVEAVEQCGGSFLPVIQNGIIFSDFCDRLIDYDFSLIAIDSEKKHILSVLDNCNFRNICFMSGCEGGFTDNEIKTAKKSGAIPVSLGKRILRCETAAIAGCSYVIGYGEANQNKIYSI